MQKNKKAQPRRVKIGVADRNYETYCSEASDVCYYANRKVIAVMAELGIELTLESVLKYTANPEAMRSEWIDAELKAKTPDNMPDVVTELIQDKIISAFDDAYKIPFIPEAIRVRKTEFFRLEDEDEYDEYEMTSNKKRLCVNYEAIEEAASIYISDPAMLEAYDRHQAAVKAMNEFFKGHAPKASDWNITRYFVPDNKGNIKPAQLVDYSKFI